MNRFTNIGQSISERLLPCVRNPAQYIGLEINARRKDLSAAEVTVAMAFPDSYTIGISHLGSQILYHSLNDLPSVACDRAYCPMPDAEQVMRSEGIPLFGWESRCPLGEFDIIGFSLPYELCVTNVLTMLDLAGVPIHAAERRECDPIIVGGDSLADSPEPLAEFFDLFLIGDGEAPLKQLVKLVGDMKKTGASREDIILSAAVNIDGAYAPRFYEPRYNDDGTLAALSPMRRDVPAEIRRAHLSNLSDSPPLRRPLVPLAEGVHERVMLEIMRGCPNACRFCQAGATRLPVRFRSVDELLDVARDALDATGYREISLLSLSTSDYPHLAELIAHLQAEFSERKVSISLPSLRVDSQLALLPKLASDVRKGGLTIAAEAGSDRLRKAIRKNISEDDMLAGVQAAYRTGWKRVKVYFMAGLPGETEADIDAIFDLCRRLSLTGKEVMGQPGAILASVSWFVPKPHTPMQWCAMRDAEYFFAVRNRLKDLSRRSAVNFKFHWIERSVLETVIARGDRRIGDVIEAAWRNGARMDSWNEYWNYDHWSEAFEETGTDPAFYAHREIPPDELTPFSHIRCFRGEDFLRREYEKMREMLEQQPQR